MWIDVRKKKKPAQAVGFFRFLNTPSAHALQAIFIEEAVSGVGGSRWVVGKSGFRIDRVQSEEAISLNKRGLLAK